MINFFSKEPWLGLECHIILCYFCQVKEKDFKEHTFVYRMSIMHMHVLHPSFLQHDETEILPREDANGECRSTETS